MDHVLVMLADPDVSVNCFFPLSFDYGGKNPELALNNFRECLRRINSRANYDAFLHSGFRVIVRDENRSIEDTFALVERCFGLQK